MCVNLKTNIFQCFLLYETSAASCSLCTVNASFCVNIISSSVAHQVIDLIGQLHLLICILQSFVIILKHRSGLWTELTSDTVASSVLIIDYLLITHTQRSHLFNDLHLFFSPLRFVLLCVDKELDHLLLQLVGGVWTTTTEINKQTRLYWAHFTSNLHLFRNTEAQSEHVSASAHMYDP